MPSCIQLCTTPWTVAHQVALSTEFSRQEYWGGLSFPTPGDLHDPGIALPGRFFTTAPLKNIDIGSVPGKELSACEVKWSEVAQLCLTLCNPVDCSLLGSSVHGIFQAIVLEWIAISFSRGSSQPRARTLVSQTVDRGFTLWATNYQHRYLQRLRAGFPAGDTWLGRA